MRLALLIALLLSSRSAAAMPPAVAAIAAYFAVSTTVVYLVAATVILSTGMAVYGSAQARRAERKARDAAIAGMQDRMATKIASESPHRHVYGRAKVGADIVAMFTSGPRDEFRHLVCVHAAHECDAIEKIYVNNVEVGALATNGDVIDGRFASAPDRDIGEEVFTGPTFTISRPAIGGSIRAYTGSGSAMAEVSITNISGRDITVASSAAVTVVYEYKVARRFGDLISSVLPVESNPVVNVIYHLGTPDDPVDAYLHSIMPEKWPLTAVLRGLCYTIITLDLNHPEFQGGLVPIHALIRGKKLYDPRTGLTGWSQNPPLAVYDYLTGPLCGVPASDLPLAQFITAANVCDDASVVAGGRYTINGTVTADESQANVLESMAQCMAGSIVSTTWDIYAGKYIAPVAALLQTDIVGSIQITPGASDAAIYNGVKGRFISDENGHVMTDFTPYQNAAYRAADDRDLYTNIDFPFTNTSQRVTNLARIFTEDQRNGFTIKAEFSLKAWPRKVGERITFTSEFFGQAEKVYRITDKSYSPTSAVQLTLKEDAAEIWDFADAVVVDATPNSDLPDPWAIAALASLSCTSGEATLLRQADGTMVPRILTTWPVATTQAVFTNGSIEIEWRAIGTDTWSKTTVSGSETQAYLSPITPGFFYVARARCVNPYLNTKSDWVASTYQVQVFSARPVVYKWAESKPAAPTGAALYTWGAQAYGAAPTGWSLLIPAKPTTGADVSLWVASPLVTDTSISSTTAFEWSTATVSAVGYAAAAAIETAVAAAQAKADLAQETAIAYADGIVTAEEERAIADAQAKADAAQAAAEAAAALDATAKANVAATTAPVGGRNIIPSNSLPSSAAGFTLRNINTVPLESEVPIWENANHSVGNSGSVYIHASGTPPINTAVDIVKDASAKYAVIPGVRYEAGVDLSANRCAAFINLDWYDASNNYISQVAGNIIDQSAATTATADFPRSVAFGVAPAGAALAMLYVRQQHNGAQSDPYTFASKWYIGRAQESQTVGSAWSDTPSTVAVGIVAAATTSTWDGISGEGKAIVEAGAADGTEALDKLTNPFTVSISGTLLSSVANSPPSRTYGNKTATITGGEAPLEIAWTVTNVTSDDGTAVSAGTSATADPAVVGVYGSAVDNSMSFIITCSVRDASGRMAYGRSWHTAIHGTIS